MTSTPVVVLLVVLLVALYFVIVFASSRMVALLAWLACFVLTLALWYSTAAGNPHVDPAVTGTVVVLATPFLRHWDDASRREEGRQRRSP